MPSITRPIAALCLFLNLEDNQLQRGDTGIRKLGDLPLPTPATMPVGTSNRQFPNHVEAPRVCSCKPGITLFGPNWTSSGLGLTDAVLLTAFSLEALMPADELSPSPEAGQLTAIYQTSPAGSPLHCRQRPAINTALTRAKIPP